MNLILTHNTGKHAQEDVIGRVGAHHGGVASHVAHHQQGEETQDHKESGIPTNKLLSPSLIQDEGDGDLNK
jgi:hypothetical protein